MDYVAATNERGVLGQHMSVFHASYDVLLTPTLPIPAFEVGRIAPAGTDQSNWMHWTPFSYPFNLTQQPAASIPCGFTASGLPVGLQIVAAKYRDDLVLRVARAYETLNPQRLTTNRYSSVGAHRFHRWHVESASPRHVHPRGQLAFLSPMMKSLKEDAIFLLGIA